MFVGRWSCSMWCQINTCAISGLIWGRSNSRQAPSKELLLSSPIALGGTRPSNCGFSALGRVAGTAGTTPQNCATYGCGCPSGWGATCITMPNLGCVGHRWDHQVLIAGILPHPQTRATPEEHRTLVQSRGIFQIGSSVRSRERWMFE